MVWFVLLVSLVFLIEILLLIPLPKGLSLLKKYVTVAMEYEEVQWNNLKIKPKFYKNII